MKPRLENIDICWLACCASKYLNFFSLLAIQPVPEIFLLLLTVHVLKLEWLFLSCLMVASICPQKYNESETGQILNAKNFVSKIVHWEIGDWRKHVAKSFVVVFWGALCVCVFESLCFRKYYFSCFEELFLIVFQIGVCVCVFESLVPNCMKHHRVESDNQRQKSSSLHKDFKELEKRDRCAFMWEFLFSTI